MRLVTSPDGATLSYDRYGSGPPLLLVHGGFSDHDTNWELVKPLLEPRFSVHAVARRGRGETDATEGHGVLDEGRDVVSLMRAIGEPVFLVGHSYGAQVSLGAAAEVPELTRKLVLYEPPLPRTLGEDLSSRLEELARAGDWEEFAMTFFRDGLSVPLEELSGLRATPGWDPIVADGRATLGDLRALRSYDFQPERFRRLALPVLLQVGTQSPRDLFATDALAAVLPDCRIEELPGQAHEGMTTAPEMYAESICRFLLS